MLKKLASSGLLYSIILIFVLLALSLQDTKIIISILPASLKKLTSQYYLLNNNNNNNNINNNNDNKNTPLTFLNQEQEKTQMLKKVASYPTARRSETVNKFFNGTFSIPEPYDWLEDPDSEETKKFVDGQNKVFEESVSGFDKKDLLKQHLTDLRKYERVGAPSLGALGSDSFTFYYNSGLLNQSKLMRVKDVNKASGATKIDENPAIETLLDPNTFSEDGTSAIGSTGWSDSRKYFGYGIAEKGSDWNTVYVMNADTKEKLKDELKWVKFSSIAWYKDEGFFYTRFPALKENEEQGVSTASTAHGSVWFHRLGEDQSKDMQVAKDDDHPGYLPSCWATDDCKYIVCQWSDGCQKESMQWICPTPDNFDSASPSGPDAWKWVKQVPDFSNDVSILGNDGDVFYFRTNKDAKNYHIVKQKLGGDMAKAEVLVPETEWKLEFDCLVGNFLIVGYLENVKHVLYISHLSNPGAVKRVDLPIATITSLSCRRESPFVSVKVSSFVLPGRTYTFELPVGEKVTKEQELSFALPPTLKMWRDEGPVGFNGDEFIVEQHFFQSPSGERKVPMFVARHKETAADGERPCLLYGYGGFDISMTPSFSIGSYVFMKHFRGVYAVANIRGGGEFAEWHDEGRLFNKMNCFQDFALSAEFLHKTLKITNPAKTAIMGGSNGGLLVAATMLLYPHLFGAIVAQVGVMDQLRFAKFGAGLYWVSDYLDSDKDEESLQYLLKYCPCRNVKANVIYPPVLVATGDHDDRVAPLHSHKWTATLQHTVGAMGGPILERVEVKAGHGGGKPLSKVIEEQVDTYAFISLALNAPLLS